MNVKRFFIPPGTPFRLLVILVVSALLAGFRFVLAPVDEHLRTTSREAPTLNVEAARRLDASVLWIDARSETEFQTNHIPGALWMNETNFESGIDALLNRWTPRTTLIVYCGSTACNASQQLAARLKASGFESVYVLEDGWRAWQKP